MKVGLTGCVFLVFLILKLTGYIAWSWLWVTAPLWGGLALMLGVVLVGIAAAGLGIGAVAGIEAFKNRRSRR